MRKPCCDKKQNVQGAWSTHEDQKLKDYIHKHGHGRWQTLAKAAGLQRCGKSCRLRWMNYLKPDIKKGNFGEDEDDLIIKLHALLGNRWSLIAGRLPGRTDNEIKNYWNTHLSRKLQKSVVTDIWSKPLSVGVQQTLTYSDHNVDECSSSLSSCSDSQRHKRLTVDSGRNELPDLNIGLSTMSCGDGEEINEVFAA